jgi:hypothetical protein
MTDIDELEARLLAIETRLGDVRAATPPITIGELTDVPTPGSGINSPWAQEVTRRSAHRFASIAERDAKYPAASAGAGALCWVTATGANYFSNGTKWAENIPTSGTNAGFAAKASGIQAAIGATLNVPVPAVDYASVIYVTGCIWIGADGGPVSGAASNVITAQGINQGNTPGAASAGTGQFVPCPVAHSWAVVGGVADFVLHSFWSGGAGSIYTAARVSWFRYKT